MRQNKPGAPAGRMPEVLFFTSAVLLYGIAVFLLLRPLAAWHYSRQADEQGLQAALALEPGNALYHYLLARFYTSDSGAYSPEKAIMQYRRTLAANPLQSAAWVYLSKAHLTAGEEVEAAYALERAVMLSPNNPELMWEAGTFWLMNNKTDKALAALKNYILLQPGRQRDVYDLCWKLGLSNRNILDKLLPDSSAHKSVYLGYLMASDRADESEEVWELLDKNAVDKNAFIAFVNFLVSRGRYEKAAVVWQDIAGAGDARQAARNSLVWNPDFEADLWNGGFDWHVYEVPGVDVFIDDIVRMNGSRSLGVAFDGTHNPGLAIAQQVVLVTSGAGYTLAGFLKTDAITTTSGVYWTVEGHNCSGLSKRSEAVTGTTSWKEIRLDFEAPAGCRAVTISFRRDQSEKLDNKIGGTAWIDGISLKPRK